MTDRPGGKSKPIRLLRAFATVGGWTMGSRILGFIRDVMIAGFLGSGPVAEAFFVAFRLPNMFRRFFAEGAFNMAFIPLFAKRLEGGEDARGFAEEALAGLLTVLLIFTALGILFMPGLMFLLAAGFAEDAAKFDLAVLYGRIQFPYLLCMSLTALFSGVLNAMGRFAAPAAAPILLNIILIGAMAGASGIALPVGDALALGVLIAGFAQVGLVAAACRSAGMGLRLRRPRWTPAMKRLVQLGVPGALAGGVTQVNLLIGTVIASFYSGAVAWLSYADRIYQLPLGVVGVAIGVVLLPELSRRVRAGDEAGARGAFNRAAEFSLALTLPAAAALIVIPGALASVLFARGAFSAEDAAAVGIAVAIFAAGLPAFVLQKVLQPAYFAREDTVSPLKFAAASMVLNTVVSVGGAAVYGWIAIPVGTALAGWLNVALLWYFARRFGDAVRADERLRRRVPRLVLSSVLMGVAVWVLSMLLAEALIAPGIRYIALGGIVLTGAVTYAVFALALGGARASDLKAGMRRG